MPRRQPITSFTAGRPLRLNGTLYAKGATIPPATVAGLKKASHLLSKGWIIAGNAMYPRKSLTAARLAKPAPRYLNPKERRAAGA